jgi:hypothetical protein
VIYTSLNYLVTLLFLPVQTFTKYAVMGALIGAIHLAQPVWLNVNAIIWRSQGIGHLPAAIHPIQHN